MAALASEKKFWLRRRPRTAVRADSQVRIEFEVTNPFHPWRGERFDLTTRKRNWGEDRVMFYDAEDGFLAACVMNGRRRTRCFHDDLAILAALIEQIERGHGQLYACQAIYQPPIAEAPALVGQVA
ncbi:Y4bD/Y4pK family protein [Mesorhizobium caraganae]|uniref:Y4bD/Y4pK family protein n=1 Tax=Mesorhizobium caraganae TaxID=483206 RepID=A0ABV1Z8F8_9HYPH